MRAACVTVLAATVTVLCVTAGCGPTAAGPAAGEEMKAVAAKPKDAAPAQPAPAATVSPAPKEAAVKLVGAVRRLGEVIVDIPLGATGVIAMVAARAKPGHVVAPASKPPPQAAEKPKPKEAEKPAPKTPLEEISEFVAEMRKLAWTEPDEAAGRLKKALGRWPEYNAELYWQRASCLSWKEPKLHGNEKAIRKLWAEKLRCYRRTKQLIEAGGSFATDASGNREEMLDKVIAVARKRAGK